MKRSDQSFPILPSLVKNRKYQTSLTFCWMELVLVVKPSRNAGVCGPPSYLNPEFPAFEACERRRKELYQKLSWAGGQVDNLEGRDPRLTFEQWKTGGPWLFLRVPFWGKKFYGPQLSGDFGISSINHDIRFPIKQPVFHEQLFA